MTKVFIRRLLMSVALVVPTLAAATVVSSGAGTPAAADPTCVAPVSGTWGGTIQSNDFGPGTLSGTFSFTPAATAGDYTFTGSGSINLPSFHLLVNGTLSGTVSCGVWSASFLSTSPVAEVDLTSQSSTDTSASGTYMATLPDSTSDMGTWSIQVVDQDLSIATPPDITVSTANPDGAVVTYALPTVTDEDSSVPTPTCVMPSGSTFPMGPTTVTCSATDPDDNPSTVTSTFVVTVRPPCVVPDSGTWSGTITSQGFGPGTLNGDLTFAPTGTDGDYTLAGSGTLTLAELHGPSFQGSFFGTESCGSWSVEFVSLSPVVLVELTGQSNGPDNASGTYGATSDIFDSDDGSWSIQFVDQDLNIGTPANVTVSATNPGGAVVNYPLPTVTDEDSSVPTATCVMPPGSTFPIGTTSVTCTATDPDDSPSTVTSTFTVTVLDTDLGLPNVPANVTVSATSPSGAVVNYQVPTAVDEDAPLPVATCSDPSGSTFPIGTTTVSCTVDDGDDNPSTAANSFAVTVLGATAQTTSLINQVTNVGAGSSLTGKLQSVETEIAANDKSDACGTLGAFINSVNAQSGKKITTSVANQLIAAAQNIKATLGC